MTTKPPPKAPDHLSAEATDWWDRVARQWELDDAGQLSFMVALEAFDRMRQAQGILAEDGAVVLDRFNQRKAHPATVTERDSRAAMLTAMAKLNLDVEPLHDKPGRPPGR
jgi:P27 family predicted phage terminase small subunit